MTAIFKPGAVFAGYTVESRLGQGGMAVVYLAWDPRLERKIALKIISEGLAEDKRFRQRFIREAKIAASLGHPNVVPVFAAGEADGVLFLAMQYVDGIDLKAIIRRDGPLDAGRTLSILGQVAKALDAAHKKSLVHRDVKPANILVSSRVDPQAEDQVYLSDFGLTKRSGSDSGLTMTGQFLGTVDYVAPEQIKGWEVDGRVDIYALGCVLYECLTGLPPFERDSEAALIYAHLMDPPPLVTSKRPDLPGAIDLVVAKAMAKSQDGRYPTAAALIDAAGVALTAEGPVRPVRQRLLRSLAPLRPSAGRFWASIRSVWPRLTGALSISRPASLLRWNLRTGLIVGIGALALAIIATGIFAFRPHMSSGATRDNRPVANAKGLIPADDPDGAVRVAELLFPGPAGGSVAKPCGADTPDGYSSCPVTNGLAGRLGQRPMGTFDPLCRCPTGYTAVGISISATDAGAIAHVTLKIDSGKSTEIDVVELRTTDGWVASDTECSGIGDSTSIFKSNPGDCTVS